MSGYPVAVDNRSEVRMTYGSQPAGQVAYGGYPEQAAAVQYQSTPATAYQYTPATLQSMPAGRSGNRQTTGLFMDDPSNWKSIADIAKALVIIEANEQLFVDELMKLPGGAEALQWLKGGGAGMNKENALAKIKAGIEAAKQNAHNIALDARQKAAVAKERASKADELAEEAEAYQDLGIQHQNQLKQARAKENEAKWAGEARRLSDLAAQAMADAQQEQQSFQQAQELARQHEAYAAKLAQDLENQKRELQRLGVPEDDPEGDFQEQEIRAVEKGIHAKKTSDAAARAQQKAQDMLAKLSKVEQAVSSHNPAMQVLSNARSMVDKSKHSKSRLATARQKVEGLKAIIAQLQLELDEAMRLEALVAAEAAQDAQNAAGAEQQAEPLQREFGLDDIPASPQEAIDEARQHAQKAAEEAQRKMMEAQASNNEAQGAQQMMQRVQAQLQAAPSLDALEDALENARYEAERARAGADALGPVSDAALRRAEVLRDKANKAADKAREQALKAQQEEAIMSRQMNELLPGVGARVDPATGRTYYTGPNGEISWNPPNDQQIAQWDKEDAKNADAAAKKALETAQKAEADAMRMDELVWMLERTMQERSMLEDIVAKARTEAVRYEKDVEDMAERAYDLNYTPDPSKLKCNSMEPMLPLAVQTVRPDCCPCGNTFMADADFCRKCGKQRGHEVPAGGNRTAGVEGTGEEQSIYKTISSLFGVDNWQSANGMAGSSNERYADQAEVPACGLRINMLP